jgi:hypothetical protein
MTSPTPFEQVTDLLPVAAQMTEILRRMRQANGTELPDLLFHMTGYVVCTALARSFQSHLPKTAVAGAETLIAALAGRIRTELLVATRN